MAEAGEISELSSMVSEPKYNNIVIFLNDNPTLSDYDMLTIIREVYESVKTSSGSGSSAGGGSGSEDSLSQAELIA